MRTKSNWLAVLTAAIIGTISMTGGTFAAEEAATDTTMTGIRIECSDGTVFDAAFDPQPYKANYDYWSINEPYKGTVSANTETLSELFNTANTMYIAASDDRLKEEAEAVTESVSEAETEADPGEAYADVQLTLHSDAEDTQVAFRVSKIGAQYELKTEGHASVATTDSSAEELLHPVTFDYILKLPVLVDSSTVSKAVLSDGSKEGVLERVDDAWTWNGKNLKNEKFTEIYQTLLDVTISGEAEASAAISDEPILTLRFERTIEDAPVRTESFYETDGDEYVVCIDDAVWFLVEEEQLEGMKNLL